MTNLAGLLTESELRKRLKGQDLKAFKTIDVPKGTIVTPSAKGFLSEHHIQLNYIEDTSEMNIEVEEEVQRSSHYKYTTLYGGVLQEKPEHMTSLYGNVLVFKDHKRIIFRGKLDSLESKILETQTSFHALKCKRLVADLQEILEFVRQILRCEVLEEELQELSLQNMNEAEMREISHNPQKYYGIDHLIPDYKMGEVLVRLNTLRSTTRETELAAYEAFKEETGEAKRKDIILALNRLSSLFWIMMLKYHAGQYNS